MINLAEKDYFTVAEAAEYACISVSQWRARVQREFSPGEFCGKLIYRRVDVQRYIESKVKWPKALPERSFLRGRRLVLDHKGEAHRVGDCAGPGIGRPLGTDNPYSGRNSFSPTRFGG